MADNPTATPPAAATPPATPGEQSDTPPNTVPGQEPQPAQQPNEVERERARAATALREKADIEKQLKKAERDLRLYERTHGPLAGRTPAAGDTPAADTSGNGMPDVEIERLNAERGVANLLAFNPQFGALLEKDPTLRDILQRNPLALINQYIDAEDAVDQIKEILEGRLGDTSQASTPTPQPTPTTMEPTPTPAPAPTPALSSEPAAPFVPVPGMTITPEQAVAMDQKAYAALPDAVRHKLLNGETVTL